MRNSKRVSGATIVIAFVLILQYFLYTAGALCVLDTAREASTAMIKRILSDDIWESLIRIGGILLIALPLFPFFRRVMASLHRPERHHTVKEYTHKPRIVDAMKVILLLATQFVLYWLGGLFVLGVARELSTGMTKRVMLNGAWDALVLISDIVLLVFLLSPIFHRWTASFGSKPTE